MVKQSFGPDKNFVPENDSRSEKFEVKKEFWTEKSLVPKNILGSKKFLVQKNFWSKSTIKYYLTPISALSIYHR